MTKEEDIRIGWRVWLVIENTLWPPMAGPTPTLNEISNVANHPYSSALMRAECPHGGISSACVCGIHFEDDVTNLLAGLRSEFQAVTWGVPSGRVIADLNSNLWPTANRAEEYRVMGIVCEDHQAQALSRQYDVPTFTFGEVFGDILKPRTYHSSALAIEHHIGANSERRGYAG
ncbi:hypothetical protein [Tsukamurella tyrosinosolvens]|uniref:hypothetical protein n=1 Tax=Tsukamurella tyrosinosolvens TaxID=57704 RepID=UPI001147317C|nr:hypothetical protein [Tsukamurella tyrosinosolvens]